MNDTWGYQSYDNNWKSTDDLLRNLADIASKGGNFLLNVGPTAEGLIPDASVERLAAIGAWMKVNGESITGTTASPLGRVPWGRCTARPGKLYLHVFDWPKDGGLVVAGLKNKVVKAYLLANTKREPLGVRREGDVGVVIAVPNRAIDPVNTVVVLEIEGEPDVAAPSAEVAADGSITLKAIDAIVHGSTAAYESGNGKDNIGFWTDPADYVTWNVRIAEPGNYGVEIEYACPNGSEGSEYIVWLAGKELAGKVEQTGSWTDFKSFKLGAASVDKAGACTLTVRPKTMPKGAVMNLKSVRLAPAK